MLLNLIRFYGCCCVIFTVTRASESDVFSIFNDKESDQVNNNKKVRSSFPRDTFELTFPFLNELFPLSGLNEKSKESIIQNNIKEEKDTFLDITDAQTGTTQQEKYEKGIKQKNGKDKFIMSFTELFIPFRNHKSQFEFNNLKPKSNNIFDDVFSNFQFMDFGGDGLLEKHSIKKHKLPKRKFDKNLISSTNNTESFAANLFENDFKDSFPKQPLLSTFDSKLLSSPHSLALFSKDNNSDKLCCESHEKCHNDGHCNVKTCKSNQLFNESKNETIENDLNKKSILLDKTFLICAIPGLIGISALIFGIEVLRRHNDLVKQKPFFSQYNQVQSC